MEFSWRIYRSSKIKSISAFEKYSKALDFSKRSDNYGTNPYDAAIL